MKIKINILMLMLASLVFFGGCSKDVEEYNKPAAYWYKKLISSIANGDIEKADNYYSSLQGEHIGSPLLPEATLVLAIAHLHHQEYLLTEHFSNEYIKRYANANEREYAEFLKIKAKYMALPNPRRDQVLIKEAIKEGEIFKLTYPRSMYYALVDTMLTNLRMAEASLNEAIASLYDRLDKPTGAEYYRNIKPQPWMDWNEIDRANTPWYREWFEGDGTESWYAFMIPDMQSIVSRNTVSSDVNSIDDIDTGVEVEQAKEVKVLTAAEKQEILEDKLKNMSAIQEYEMKKTRELMDKGVLSEEDFEAIRDEILED